jgi:nucleotide-binding universal stress UspA family protein
MTSQAHTDATVVAGFDDSTIAFEAARLAADEAYRRGLSLTLVHGFTWPWTTPQPVPGAEPPDPHARRRIQHQLSAAAERLRAEFRALAIRERMVDGHAGAVLVDYSHQAALVVVGHRGEGGFTGLLAGSVATHVAAHAECPVVVMRGIIGKPDDPVVVGVDGSPESQRATAFAYDVADLRGAPLTIVTVSPPGHAGPGPIARDLDALAARHPDVVVRHEMINNQRSPAAGLIHAAGGAGLVVVGSRGVSGLRGILLGSVGRALIDHAPCPVAILRGR